MRIIGLALITALSATPAPAAEIHTRFEGVPELAQKDFDTAAGVWEQCLVSDVPINIRVTWIERGPTGFAYQNAVRNLPDLPKADVWYPTALANALTGERVARGDDINIFLSGRTNWYFDSDTPIAEDETDFINVAVHEIAHGLGISSTSFVPWQGEPIGALGLPNAYTNYFDYSFDLHPQDGTMSLYDSFIRLADGRGLADFENPSLDLTKALANPTLHFSGDEARKANLGFPVGVVPLNISHIPAAPRSPNPIMLPDSGQGESIRIPDRLLIGMLQDLGWTISETCKPSSR